MNKALDNLLENVDSRETGLSDFVDFAHPDLFHKARAFARFLADGRPRGYDTYVHRVSHYAGGSAVIDGEDRASQQRVVMMCSADYLGLAHHPGVLGAAKQAIDRFGASVCSVPLIAGATSLHSELEEMLAGFVGAEACVIFPTGQAANVGLIQALCTPRDTVILDKLVHYSILDGVRLSGARWHSFRHSDPEHLARVLETARSKRKDSGILVVVEGVYGIDGDVPPLRDLLGVCSRFGARVMVDDAHATGVLGKVGRGSVEVHGIDADLPVLMGSLSKALGNFGGWIAAPAEVVDYLRYYARTIAFSVGLPASCVGGAMAALGVIQDEPAQLAKLRDNIELFRDGLLSIGIANAAKSGSAIVSAPVGSERALRDVARELFRHSVYAEALGFPAIPRGQERIRFRVSAAHTRQELQQVVLAVEEAMARCGVASMGRPIGGEQQSIAAGRGCVVPEGNASSTKTRVADLAIDCARIAELSFRAAAVRGYPMAWLLRDDYEKAIKGQGLPGREASSFCHFVAETCGELRASVCASLEPRIGVGDGQGVGALGHIHWLPGDEALVAGLLVQAKEWLVEKGARTVVAPIQTPLLRLGGGVGSEASPSVLPMLQPHTSPVLARLLRDVGFQPDSVLGYWRVNLAEALAGVGRLKPCGVAIRSMDKTHLRREVSIIHPVLNQSLGTLEHCGTLALDELYGVAHDLRDLVVGEFWKIAEIDGRTAGFIGAFPDVNQALLEAGGGAGTTDIENISLAIAGARRAEIAWLGVGSEFQGQGVGGALLQSLYAELLGRNFTEAWLSWAFVDGCLRTKDFLPSDGAVVGRLEYTVFKWHGGGNGSR